jgi:hypothetical protein
MALFLVEVTTANLVTVLWVIVTFGERQMVAQPIARRLLVSPLINKDFRDCHPLFARGNFASVNPNHQKCRRAGFVYLSAE